MNFPEIPSIFGTIPPATMIHSELSPFLLFTWLLFIFFLFPILVVSITSLFSVYFRRRHQATIAGTATSTVTAATNANNVPNGRMPALSYQLVATSDQTRSPFPGTHTHRTGRNWGDEKNTSPYHQYHRRDKLAFRPNPKLTHPQAQKTRFNLAPPHQSLKTILPKPTTTPNNNPVYVPVPMDLDDSMDLDSLDDPMDLDGPDDSIDLHSPDVIDPETTAEAIITTWAMSPTEPTMTTEYITEYKAIEAIYRETAEDARGSNPETHEDNNTATSATSATGTATISKEEFDWDKADEAINKEPWDKAWESGLKVGEEEFDWDKADEAINKEPWDKAWESGLKVGEEEFDWDKADEAINKEPWDKAWESGLKIGGETTCGGATTATTTTTAPISTGVTNYNKLSESAGKEISDDTTTTSVTVTATATATISKEEFDCDTTRGGATTTTTTTAPILTGTRKESSEDARESGPEIQEDNNTATATVTATVTVTATATVTTTATDTNPTEEITYNNASEARMYWRNETLNERQEGMLLNPIPEAEEAEAMVLTIPEAAADEEDEAMVLTIPEAADEEDEVMVIDSTPEAADEEDEVMEDRSREGEGNILQTTVTDTPEEARAGEDPAEYYNMQDEFYKKKIIKEKIMKEKIMKETRMQKKRTQKLGEKGTKGNTTLLVLGNSSLPEHVVVDQEDRSREGEGNILQTTVTDTPEDEGNLSDATVMDTPEEARAAIDFVIKEDKEKQEWMKKRKEKKLVQKKLLGKVRSGAGGAPNDGEVSSRKARLKGRLHAKISNATGASRDLIQERENLPQIIEPQHLDKYNEEPPLRRSCRLEEKAKNSLGGTAVKASGRWYATRGAIGGVRK
ncbi:uncharacterized protein LAJ45_04888 [Morchella importuna]|uniref:uncharacterized protein n=1 Tax=Morchella importuna TaxID=1174673 RepID=UPI001E8E5D67|nr:uncharacterized protein LAJ45_04888 [Morchella importuna]KAH8151186.1 hypothetical protein LAJ45_04888 [Morchella importuna]